MTRTTDRSNKPTNVTFTRVGAGCPGLWGAALLLSVWYAAFGGSVDSKTAANAVSCWLRSDRSPLGEPLGTQVKRVETFNDDKGGVLYYVVYLDPAGFVVVPADDLVEPILAFASRGRFDPSAQNPLATLVNRDVRGRVAFARGLATPLTNALSKWHRLGEAAPSGPGPDGSGQAQPLNLSTVSSIRVAPFLQTSWNQQAAFNGLACYNYYVPPGPAGNPNNYPCGCVATALAQLLYYFHFPSVGVGTGSRTVYVNGNAMTAGLRGGDGAGGPYLWNNMPLAPWSPTVSQCQAIGALTYDAGLAVNMDYAAEGTGAFMSHVKTALLGTFGYNSAVFGGSDNGNQNIGAGLVGMINPNLDARQPVLLGVFGAPGGHCIVCDGYGYNSSTLYHHLNLGWGGTDSAWYALPTVDTGIGTFTTIASCIYNVYTNGSGEIISGRVVDGGGRPVAGASVSASVMRGGSYITTTDTNGIYALIHVPCCSQYSLLVTKAGYSPATGYSSTGFDGDILDVGVRSGNVWGADFTLTTTPPTISSQPQNQTAVSGGTAIFTVAVSGTAPLAYQWLFQATNLPGATGASLVLSNVSAASAGIYAVRVTNMVGSILSSNAQLTVLPVGLSYQIGSSGSGQLSAPRGIATDSAGNIYVVDSGNYRIQKFAPDGTYLAQWGGLGNGPGQFGGMTAVAVDGSGQVYVADYEPTSDFNSYQGRIQKFSSNGSFLLQWSGSGANTMSQPWGLAVDGSQNVYVADYWSCRVQKYSSGGTLLAQWGQFWYPPGVAVDSSGNVYVADNYMDNNYAFHGRVQKFSGNGQYLSQWTDTGAFGLLAWCNVAVDSSGRVYVVASRDNIVGLGTFAANGAYLGAWGSYGSGPGQFNTPWGVALDGAGNVYVTDLVNNRVEKFSSNGQCLAQWGDMWQYNPRLNNPKGVAVDSRSQIYVADTDDNCLQVYSAMGAYLAQWGGPGTNAGQLSLPASVAVDAVDNIYVADSGNNRIQKLSTNGSCLALWGSSGAGANQFNKPVSVAVSSTGDVYVADSGNNRIQRFSSSGAYLGQWGGSGTGAGHFNNPVAVAVDDLGQVYVAEWNRVQQFSASGTYLAQWGSYGTGAGQFDSADGITVDKLGNIYVADAENNRIQQFSSPGIFSCQVGGFGSAPGQFYLPAGLAVDKSGTLYVADSGNERIQILNFPTPPVIRAQPVPQMVAVGASATFNVGVGSFSPTTYQWQFGGADLAGATLSALTLSNIQLSNAGPYQIVVRNQYNTVTSAPAALIVFGVPPQIATQPQNQAVRQGTPCIFTVVASGTQPLCYQWLFNGTTVLTGCTNATLVLPKAALADAGTYTAVVTNNFGIAFSSPAALNILPSLSADPSPRLAIALSNAAVVVRWPSGASNYILETTTELPYQGLWQPWGISGDDGLWKSAVISSNSLLPHQYFRLRLP